MDDNSIKILIIDDDIALANAIKLVLDNEQYESKIAIDAAKAVEILSAESFDILLCDYNLPDMNGIELIKKTSKLAPEAVPLLITGISSMDLAFEGMRVGVHDYLVKPIDYDELKKIISDIIKERENFNKGKENLHSADTAEPVQPEADPPTAVTDDTSEDQSVSIEGENIIKEISTDDEQAVQTVQDGISREEVIIEEPPQDISETTEEDIADADFEDEDMDSEDAPEKSKKELKKEEKERKKAEKARLKAEKKDRKLQEKLAKKQGSNIDEEDDESDEIDEPAPLENKHVSSDPEPAPDLETKDEVKDTDKQAKTQQEADYIASVEAAKRAAEEEIMKVLEEEKLSVSKQEETQETVQKVSSPEEPDTSIMPADAAAPEIQIAREEEKSDSSGNEVSSEKTENVSEEDLSIETDITHKPETESKESPSGTVEEAVQVSEVSEKKSSDSILATGLSREARENMENLQKAEEEKLKAEEEARREAEAEARKKAEEDLRRTIESDIKRKSEEDALRESEAAEKRAAEEAKLRQEAEERARKLEEELAKKEALLRERKELEDKIQSSVDKGVPEGTTIPSRDDFAPSHSILDDPPSSQAEEAAPSEGNDDIKETDHLESILEDAAEAEQRLNEQEEKSRLESQPAKERKKIEDIIQSTVDKNSGSVMSEDKKEEAPDISPVAEPKDLNAENQAVEEQLPNEEDIRQKQEEAAKQAADQAAKQAAVEQEKALRAKREAEKAALQSSISSKNEENASAQDIYQSNEAKYRARVIEVGNSSVSASLDEEEKERTVFDFILDRSSEIRKKIKGIAAFIIIFIVLSLSIDTVFFQISPPAQKIHNKFWPPAIILDSVPAGASLELTDESGKQVLTTVAYTPVSIPKIEPGNYLLKMKLSGYNTIERKITVYSKSNKIGGVNIQGSVNANASTDKTQKFILPFELTVKIDSEPSGATVYLDGKKLGSKTPLSVNLTAAAHTVMLEKEGFSSLGNLEKYDTYGQCNLDFSKQDQKGIDARYWRLRQSAEGFYLKGHFWKEIKVTSKPSGAQFIADGELLGVTPFSVKLTVGEHDFRLKSKGYKDWVETVDITEKSSISASLYKNIKIVAYDEDKPGVDISAAVIIDGKKQKTKTPVKTVVKQGYHMIQVNKPGDYIDWQKNINISSQDNIVAKLKRKKFYLSINVTDKEKEKAITGAVVQIDGAIVGETDPVGVWKGNVKGGTREISVEKPGYLKKTVKKDVDYLVKKIEIEFGPEDIDEEFEAADEEETEEESGSYAEEEATSFSVQEEPKAGRKATLASILIIDTRPHFPGAGIYLDGKYEGETIRRIPKVDPGTHEIEIRHPYIGKSVNEITVDGSGDKIVINFNDSGEVEIK